MAEQEGNMHVRAPCISDLQKGTPECVLSKLQAVEQHKKTNKLEWSHVHQFSMIKLWKFFTYSQTHFGFACATLTEG